MLPRWHLWPWGLSFSPWTSRFLVLCQLLPTVCDLCKFSLSLPPSTLSGEQERNLLTELHLFIAGSDHSAPCDLWICLASLLRSSSGRGGFSWVPPPAISPEYPWLHPFPSPKPCIYFSAASRAARAANKYPYLEARGLESGPKAEQGEGRVSISPCWWVLTFQGQLSSLNCLLNKVYMSTPRARKLKRKKIKTILPSKAAIFNLFHFMAHID